MDIPSFRAYAHKLADRMADYMEEVEQYPVKSRVKPGEIYAGLPAKPPEEAEDFDAVLADFEQLIIPGISHWQSPDFFAYFPANSSPPSVLAEMLTATLGVQGMIWETSPAAAELEERVLNWLRDAMGLPGTWEGVIQDTASTAGIAALISARERYSNYEINESGFRNQPIFRIYASLETHSSIEKAVKIAGFGRENLVKVAVDEQLAMHPTALQQAIEDDLAKGYTPLAVVATLGTTGTTALDPLEEIAHLTKKYALWLHVDAALAGTALLLPEFRKLTKGMEAVDSFVFNPHKWMFTNFDCSVYYVKDASQLIRTFEILPEYLKTRTRGQVNDYRDWGIPLGRRFRALKLWFVIRAYGIKGLQQRIREHIHLAAILSQWIEDHPDFILMAPVPLNTVAFRFQPAGITDTETLNMLNEKLMQQLNDSGDLYISHTKVKGFFTLRMVTAQTRVSEKHVVKAWKRICEEAEKLK